MLKFMNTNIRLSYKIAAVIVFGLLIAWAVYGWLGHSIIDAAHQGKSLSVLNNVISADSTYSVNHYIAIMDKHLFRLTFYALLVCFVMILPGEAKLSLASILITLLVLEVGFGIREFHLTKRYPRHPDGANFFWEHDKLLGWKKKAGAENIYASKENRIYALSRTNSKGLRDEEYSYKKDEDTIRILIIGDSGAAGLEVDKEDHFETHLEKFLNEHDKVEIINSGTRGYGTDQAFLYLKNEGYKYEPDVVLYMFFYNDLVNNTTIHRAFRKYGKPYFAYNWRGKLVLRGTPVPEKFKPHDRWLMSDKKLEEFYNERLDYKHELAKAPNSVFRYRDDYNFIYDVARDWSDFYNRFQETNFMKWVRFKLRHNEKLEDILIAQRLIKPRRTPTVRSGEPKFVLDHQWRIAKDLIDKMAHFSRSIDSMFLVYEYSHNGAQEQPTRLKKTCDALNVVYFNSFDEFFKVSRGKKNLHFAYDEHWNRRGHKLAAESMYGYLNRKEVIEIVKRNRKKPNRKEVVKKEK